MSKKDKKGRLRFFTSFRLLPNRLKNLSAGVNATETILSVLLKKQNQLVF